MSRIPLSDESADLDDDVVDEEGTTGPEEQFAELNLETDETREYENDWWEDFDDEYYDEFSSTGEDDAA